MDSESDSLQVDREGLIVHLCELTQLEAQTAREQGQFHAPSLDIQGFIHCSRVDQILGVANQFYRGIPDLVLLWIDPGKVKAEIVWEEAGNELFPHIYGELNLDAVVRVTKLTPDADGYYRIL